MDYTLILATDMNKHSCSAGPGSSEEDEGLSPTAHVMDDSGAPPAGTLDPGGAKGLVEMPDSEALRRSVAAANAVEHERQLASSNASQPALEGERGPVPATSSGVHVCLIARSVADCLMELHLSQGHDSFHASVVHHCSFIHCKHVSFPAPVAAENASRHGTPASPSICFRCFRL